MLTLIHEKVQQSKNHHHKLSSIFFQLQFQFLIVIHLQRNSKNLVFDLSLLVIVCRLKAIKVNLIHFKLNV